MKMKKGILAVVVCMFMLNLCGCAVGGKAPSITLDGSLEVKLGQTKAGEVLDAGFTNLYSHINEGGIDSMTWETLYAVKGEERFGDLQAANKSGRSIEFKDGVIFEFSVNYDGEEAVGEILINGVDFQGYTRDQVKEAMAEFEETLDTDKYLCFESGRYEYTFSFGEGSDVLSGVKINDGTEKEYN